MIARLLRVFDNPSAASWGITASLCHFTRLYGLQLVLVTLLSTVAVYRREMSCNHVYTEGETMSKSAKERSRKVDDGRVSDKWEETTEELLEGAGAFCSGEPLFTVALSIWASICLGFLAKDEAESRSRQRGPSSGPSSVMGEHGGVRSNSASCARTEGTDSITRDLPADVQVHVLSFLPPEDVVSFSCASRSSRAIVDKGVTSRMLWKTLWLRDYAWLVQSWRVGIDALRRSQVADDQRFDKHFYFMFGESYMNYILAGKNTVKECLVGLHGHIYDITDFLQSHPGSPDTLMVQAGKDATRFFEDMTHSSAARRLARRHCVVVNSFCTDNGCGVHPTGITQASGPLVPPTVEAPTIPMARTRQPRRPGTLQSIRSEYRNQERRVYHAVGTRYASNPDLLSHVNVFYDPFRREWKAWYTNTQFEAVFVHET